MSMLTLVTAAIIIGAEPSDASLDQLVARWETECVKDDASAACSGLAAQIEVGLYDLLRKLSLNREPIDRDVLRAAAESNLPPLARYGVSMLGEPKSEEDVQALLRAVNHPVLAVRFIAARNLRNAKEPRWMAMEAWWTGWTLGATSAPEESMVPDLRPEPGQFSMASFNRLEYQYYGSDRERAMFTTTESVESFVNRMRAGRRVLSSADALRERMDLLQPQLDAVQKEMEVAGEKNDMEALDRAMKKYAALSQQMSASSLTGANPMIASQTVILEQDRTTRRPTVTLTVQRDEKLNRTIAMFWREGGWRQ